MKSILTQLVRLAIAIAGLYLVLLAICLWLVPREPPERRIDTARAAETLYLTEPKYVFLARGRLSSNAPKVVLLGASNTMAGFKQRELSPRLPDVQVHNLAVGGANLTEVMQVHQLVREVQGPRARRQTTYVLGLWYGLFASDQARWFTPDRVAGDTDIDIERYRYGFYRRAPSGPSALLPASALDAEVTLIHPYLVLDALTRDLTAALRARLSGKPAKLSDEERNRRVIDVEQQQKYLAFWRSYMGSQSVLEPVQFDRLAELARRMSADGSRLLVVDMPIPAWHSQGSVLAADYQRRMARVRTELAALPGVSVLDMTEQSNDADFSDEVHPKPRVSPRWAARLADALRSNASDISASNPKADDEHG